MSPSQPPRGVEPDEPVLSEQALDRLRELDPSGAASLFPRVVAAFDATAAKLMPQLDRALAGGDLAGVAFVAHTLKSSSALIGALRLSRRCAVIEDMVKRNVNGCLASELDAMRREMDLVLTALRDRHSPLA